MKSEAKLINYTDRLFSIFLSDLKKIYTNDKLNQCKSKYLGKNSFLLRYLKKLSALDFDLKIKYSKILNIMKKKFNIIFYLEKKYIKDYMNLNRTNKKYFDVSLPGRKIDYGCLHPITLVINDIERFFYYLGFLTYHGPELEDVYHNFDALNVPMHHPARDKSDTFWFDSKRLLRTQTSNMQIRILEKNSCPIKFIVPGKVYRRDSDQTHTPMFHQVEGLIIDKSISFSNIKWILQNFICQFFQNQNLVFRFRSSYFPFTIPSAEMDIQTSSGSWLEVLGFGMIHPNVLKNFNIDNKKYSACAFGIGVERIAMIKYSVSDIRLFFENDIRFLKQFV
ncbi:phenylalanyl-tRNA synthetase, alpha subunit [Buchnera aphidicola (Cinara tujafilina)]|uniref:Phenylalanine--tRNA ligase alpha subunit n=1 Tax=Buchnera aphidicola (Cinara tujafilina) TaxID=261317 RepID=F7WZ25_9GAMM|nr:phenylalanine--tRNA ligase subunit alpha [Buchnera aphidicola]AEH39675.1 phenylalanyl-tRNA synthetase, alpha subunit [Buchnera aphidicola (Cinara tujafilina)]